MKFVQNAYTMFSSLNLLFILAIFTGQTNQQEASSQDEGRDIEL